MMQRLGRRLILSVVIVLLNLVPIAHPPTDAQAPAVPYLYYYSDTLNAFVIEHADGSDSRLFGQHLVALDHDVVDGPGWSPSGAWFAWTSSNDDPVRAHTPPRSYVIKPDNEHHLPLIDGLSNASMDWSPTSDILALYRYQGASDHDNPESISLIDTNAERTIVSFPLHGIDRLDFGPRWSPDGHLVAFYYQKSSADNQHPDWRFVSVSLDGKWDERKLEPVTFIDPVFAAIWSADGWLAHWLPDQSKMLIENEFSGANFEVAAPANALLYWSPIGKYAVLYEQLGEKKDDRWNLWLLSTKDRRLNLVARNILGAYYIGSRGFGGSWSPDGQYLVFRPTVDRLALLDPATGQIKTLPFVIETPKSLPYDPVVRWSGYEKAICLQANPNEGSITYHILTGETSLNDTSDVGLWDFSPSGRYRAFGGGKVTDLSSTQQYTLPVHSAAVSGKDVYIWSPAEDWLITGDSQVIAGGGWGYVRFGVTTVMGTIWRELGGCYQSKACAGWLPANVKLRPGATHSVLPAPAHIDYYVAHMLGFETPYRLICGQSDPHIRLVTDTQAHRTLYSLHSDQSCPFEGWIGYTALAISPDGKLLATSDADFSGVTLWSLPDGKLLTRLNTFGFELSFTPDGKELNTRSHSAMLTWRLDDILH